MKRDVNRTYSIFNNEILKNIMNYILVVLTILFSRDTLITSVKLGFYKASFIYGIFIILFGVILIINNKREIKIKKAETKGFGIFIGLLILISLIKLDFQIYIASIIFYIFVSYMFIYIFTFEDFFAKMSNVMVVLGIYSLVSCYILKPVLFPHGVVNTNIPIVTNDAGLKLFDLGLSYVVALPYYVRNFGIFREPGVYQFFLIIPMIYQLLFEKRKLKWIKIIVLSLTLISTFSMTGIVAMGLIFIIYIMKLIEDKKMTRNVMKSIIIAIILVCVLFIILYFNSGNFNLIVNETIKKMATKNDSTSTRMESIVNNIKLFTNSPLFGNDFSVVQSASLHNTNSTFSLFAIFGVLVGGISLIYQWIFSGMISRNCFIRSLIVLVLLLLINSQFLLGNTLFWVFLFSIYMPKHMNTIRDVN